MLVTSAGFLETLDKLQNRLTSEAGWNRLKLVELLLGFLGEGRRGLQKICLGYKEKKST